jgi:hypothetical protein
MNMRPEGAVVLVGVLAGLLIAVAPEGAIPLIALGAAAVAGVRLYERPMTAALLVLVPTVVLALLRAALDSDRDVGAMAMTIISSVFVTAIVTHVAAGVTARRRVQRP